MITSGKSMGSESFDITANLKASNKKAGKKVRSSLYFDTIDKKPLQSVYGF